MSADTVDAGPAAAGATAPGAGLAELLAGLDQVKKTPTGWTACCPAHSDGTPSLSIGVGKGGRILIHCHAGCSVEDVVGAVGLEMRDLFADHGKPFSKSNGTGSLGELVATFDYHDERGQLLFQVCKYQQPGATDKTFRQRRPDARGGWIWSTKGIAKPLYRLPELLAADQARIVFVPEGEKDVETLRRLGEVATTNPGGALKWRPEYSAVLRGRRCVILTDNDDVGRAHGEQVAQSLAGVAGSVKVLALPDLPEKGDITNWFEEGFGAVEDLHALVTAAPEWTPEQASAAATSEKTEAPAIVLRLASAIVHELWSKPPPPPIATPLSELDNLLGGGFRGVNILAAPTGRFKSSFVLAQARRTARTRPVVYLSTELDERQALARVAAQELGTAWRALYESDAAAEAIIAGAVEGLRLYVTTIGSVEQMLDAFAALALQEKDPPLVVVDYLQGLARAAKDRRLAVGCVSEALTGWTRSTGGVVLAVSSIARAHYFGTDEKSATDFINAPKESGDIEFDAASVMFLDVPAPPLGGTSEGRLHVAKSRFGSAGTIGVRVDGPSGTFQADPAGGLTADQRAVLEAVQAGARTWDEIGKAAGLRRNKIGPCLRALQARNLTDAEGRATTPASQKPRQNGSINATLPGTSSQTVPVGELVLNSPSVSAVPTPGTGAAAFPVSSPPFRGELGTAVPRNLTGPTDDSPEGAL